MPEVDVASPRGHTHVVSYQLLGLLASPDFVPCTND